jgi:DNA-binding transcriptional regulator YiaG
MSDQDWISVTIKKKSSSQTHSNTGASIVKKSYSNTASELRKVENSDVTKQKILTPKSRADMAAARVAMKLTQKELDMRGSFPPNSCNSWESGRICPSSSQIQILHRILHIKLERE